MNNEQQVITDSQEIAKVMGEDYPVKGADVNFKGVGATPPVDERYRIEYRCNINGLTVAEFTLKFETELEYCGLDKDGHCLAIDKSEFVALHAFKSELDIAEEKQVEEVSKLLSKNGMSHDTIWIKCLQSHGMLAGIKL